MKIWQKCLSIFLLQVLLFILFSCKKGWDGSIEYRNGIKTVENRQSPIWGDYINDKIKIDESISMGSNSISQTDIFYEIGDINTDYNNNIYILDKKSCVLFKYDTDGILLWWTGNKGQGPGEFQNPACITEVNDTKIGIFEIPNQLHYFDKDGNFLHTKKIKSNYNYCYKLPNENYLFVKTTIGQLGWKADLYSKELVLLRLFADEYRYGKKLSVGGGGYLGGGFNLSNEFIFFVLPDKYEIRIYMPSGKCSTILKRQIRLEPPDIDVSDKSFSIGMSHRLGPCMSYNNEYFINHMMFIDKMGIKCYFDFFNNKGQFLGTYKCSNIQRIMHIDTYQNIYIYESTPFPRVTKNRIIFLK